MKFLYVLPDIRESLIHDKDLLGFSKHTEKLKACHYHHSIDIDNDTQIQCFIQVKFPVKNGWSQSVYRLEICTGMTLTVNCDGHLGNDAFLYTNTLIDEEVEDIYSALLYRKSGAELLLCEM